jgi:probable rRNA maturation factor
LGFLDAELSITLVDDAAIAELAGRFGREARPTDVLAFALAEAEGAEYGGNLLGDVILSVETAAAQAVERGVPLDLELRDLLVHGVLHILGMDHARSHETRAMRELEHHLHWELERLA